MADPTRGPYTGKFKVGDRVMVSNRAPVAAELAHDTLTLVREVYTDLSGKAHGYYVDNAGGWWYENWLEFPEPRCFCHPTVSFDDDCFDCIPIFFP